VEPSTCCGASSEDREHWALAWAWAPLRWENKVPASWRDVTEDTGPHANHCRRKHPQMGFFFFEGEGHWDLNLHIYH
jgi:hypothetical protein